MKKLTYFTLILLLMGYLVGCGEGNNSKPLSSTSNPTNNASNEKNTLDKLSIGFVPSKDPNEIIQATEPLKNLVKNELNSSGYTVKEVEITVGANYEAVGEALSTGAIDVGLIPGGTYVLYDEGAEVILTATRSGLSNDTDSPKDWNSNEPTKATDKQATFYRSLIIAGPSEKGKQLAAKVNNGEALTFDDLTSASWSVMSTSSPAGYVYPSLWLQEHFGKTIADLNHIVQADSYGAAFTKLAAGQIDVLLTYADARRDFEQKWTSEFGRTSSIWEETDVIGVTPGIYNDTISVSKHSKIMNDKLKQALQQAFINIANTNDGKEVIKIYTHEGYQKGISSDYDNERKAQALVQQLGTE